jgi:hypothetical protein
MVMSLVSHVPAATIAPGVINCVLVLFVCIPAGMASIALVLSIMVALCTGSCVDTLSKHLPLFVHRVRLQAWPALRWC